MDYALKNRLLCGTSEILETVSQQPVDLDFTLPDYCADIEKILKCSLIPKIYTRTFSAGQLRIDGASTVRILYCDSGKKALRCCEQTLPFSATIPVSGETQENIILTTAKPEYLNCRALSPRRLSVHGAFSLYASVIGKQIHEIREGTEDVHLQVKSENKEVCELCEFIQEQFSVNESVSLRTGSSVETIVRSQVSAVLTDVNESKDRLNLSGEITLRMLYICDSVTGETDQFIYVFPFSQSVGAKEQNCDISDIRLDVLSFDLLLKSEMLSDEPVINIDAKLCASVMGYKREEITYISDAYSVRDNTELSYENVPLCCDIMPVVKNGVVKSSLNLGDKKIRKIVDIFNEDPSLFAEISDTNLTIKGKTNICIFALTEEGELVSVERQVDIEATETLEKAYGCVKNPSAQITAVSFRMTDNNELEVRLDVRFSVVAFTCETITQVISAEKTGECTKAHSHALTLYYAHCGENIWDIAKYYRTPIHSICDENSITEDNLTCDKMLLILRA